jgi:hypothetical protein
MEIKYNNTDVRRQDRLLNKEEAFCPNQYNPTELAQYNSRN